MNNLLQIVGIDSSIGELYISTNRGTPGDFIGSCIFSYEENLLTSTRWEFENGQFEKLGLIETPAFGWRFTHFHNPREHEGSLSVYDKLDRNRKKAEKHLGLGVGYAFFENYLGIYIGDELDLVVIPNGRFDRWN